MTFLELLQLGRDPKSKLLAAGLIQARCPSCHPTNSIKAMNGYKNVRCNVLKCLISNYPKCKSYAEI